MKKRLCPQREFPPYAFIPGKNPHPLKEGGHSFSQGEPHLTKINTDAPYDSEDFLYALDLFNHAYYWETHMYLEALWNAHQRKGDACHLFLAIIKLSAAAIKWKLGQEKAATGHINRAIEHLGNIEETEILGFDIAQLKSKLENVHFLKENESPIVFDFFLIPQKD